MVNSNTSLKKKSGEKASEIATRCFVAIIILNIIMAFIAILIPDDSSALMKLYGSFALFLLPALITVGNLRYIEQYNLTIKIFSWISIASSVLAVLLGIIYIWTGGNAFATSEAYDDMPSSNYSTNSSLEARSSNYLTTEYDDDDLYDDLYDDDYDYGDYYDYDDYYNYYDLDDDDDLLSTYSSPSYNTGGLHVSDFIPAILKIYLVSSIIMLSAFFIASCLKYKNYSTPVVGLKIASTVCVSYCCLVAVSFLLFPITLDQMATRFAILALVLTNAGFYSWLALVIIAYNEKRKATIVENTQNEAPIEAAQDNTRTIPEPASTAPESTPDATEPAPTDAPTTPAPTQPTPEA